MLPDLRLELENECLPRSTEWPDTGLARADTTPGIIKRVAGIRQPLSRETWPGYAQPSHGGSKRTVIHGSDQTYKSI